MVTERGVPRQVLSIRDAKAANRGKWILGQVVSYDQHHQPLEINIITTSSSRQKISKVLKKLPVPSQQEPPQSPYYVFHAPPAIGPVKRWLLDRFL